MSPSLEYSYIDYSHKFVGNALVRFERSTLPKHQGTRTVLLRFLKIIPPVNCVKPLYDGYVHCPREGELHQKSKVWGLDIDKAKIKRGKSKSLRGLQLLWDV